MEIQSTLLFIVALVNSILSLFVLFGKRDVINVVYSVFGFFVSFWSIALGFFILEESIDRSLLITNFFYFFAAGIPLFFLYFSFIFPNKSLKINKTYLFFLCIPLVLIGVLLFLDRNFFIQSIWFTEWGKDVLINKSNYILYTIYFLVFTTFAYFNLLQSYKTSKLNNQTIEKNQLRLIIGGTLVGFIFGMIFDLFLPLFGNYEYIYIGPIFSFSMVGAIAYSIMKYHLFNIKVIATEITMVVLWVVILVRTILAETPKEQFINIGFLLVMVAIGVILIKSVIKEVAQREKIEKLAVDLEHANSRLKELDQLKSEFLSLATHQIRAPLATVKGFASLILEGDYGEVSDEVKGVVKIISQSTENLVVIVNEFLDISRIEQGRMKYTLSDFNMKTVLTQILDQYKPSIEQAQLTSELHADLDEYITHADEGKVRQVIGNLIDNAIKYTPAGRIDVTLSKVDDKIRFSIKDTGVGVASEDIPKLFEKFIRTKIANKQNVIGTGLGLYVAKQMIEAQGGKIWLESEGVNKGTTFIVELPSKK